MKDFIHKIVISILGVLFLAGFNVLFPQPSILHYASLLSFIILFYYLIYPLLLKIWAQIVKLYRVYFPEIGILNGNINSPLRECKCERVWTNITPSMWEVAVKKNITKRTELITTYQISNSYSIIINPFGDSFPEQDAKLHKTFYSICEYIKNGGIFVVTGGAFFSHQNTTHSSQHQWVFTKTIEGIQSLKESFLFLEFGIQTTGDTYANGQLVSNEPVEVEIHQTSDDQLHTGKIDIPQRIKRFRAATPATSNYIPFVREKDGKSFPIIAVQYGKGYLLHAGLFLESEGSAEFSLLIKLIDNLVKNRFRSL